MSSISSSWSSSSLSSSSQSSSSRSSSSSSSSGSLSINLHIDSDNNNGLNPPDKAPETEDAIEDDEDKPGKLIRASDGDFTDNGVPDFADGIDVFENEGDNLCPRFPQLILECQGATEKTRFIFDYPGCDPALITREDLAEEGEDPFWSYYPFDPENPPSDPIPRIRIWTKNGDQSRASANVADGGDYVAPGIEYTAEDLGLEEGNSEVTFYVEGIFYSEGLCDQRIVVTAYNDEGAGVPADPPTDAVRATVFNFDIENRDITLCNDFESHDFIAFATLPGTNIQWELVLATGDGTLSDEFSVAEEGGKVVTTLDLSENPGEAYQVKAKVVGFVPEEDTYDGPELYSGVITIAAGTCAEISVELTRNNASATELPADGQSTMQVAATFLDAYGNTVEPNTPVHWYLGGLGEIVSKDSLTDGQGMAWAVIRSGIVAENQKLFVEADLTQQEVTIPNTALTIELTSSQSGLDISNSSDETLLTADFGDVADGTAVEWFSTNGELIDVETNTVEGIATAKLTTNGAVLADAIVMVAAANFSSVIVVPFTSSAPVSISIQHPVISGDESADDESSVENIQGGESAVDFFADTSLEIIAPGYPGYSAVLTVSDPTLLSVSASNVQLNGSGRATVVLHSLGAYDNDLGDATQIDITVTLLTPPIAVAFGGAAANPLPPPPPPTATSVLMTRRQTYVTLTATGGELRFQSGTSQGGFSDAQLEQVSASLLGDVADGGATVGAVSLIPGGSLQTRRQYAFQAAVWIDECTDLSGNQVLNVKTSLKAGEQLGLSEEEKQWFSEGLTDLLLEAAAAAHTSGDNAEALSVLAEEEDFLSAISELSEDQVNSFRGLYRMTDGQSIFLGESLMADGFGEGLVADLGTLADHAPQEEIPLWQRAVQGLRSFSDWLPKSWQEKQVETLDEFARKTCDDGVASGDVDKHTAAGLGYGVGLLKTLQSMSPTQTLNPVAQARMGASLWATIIAAFGGSQEARDGLKRAVPLWGTYLNSQDTRDLWAQGKYYDSGSKAADTTVSAVGDATIVYGVAKAGISLVAVAKSARTPRLNPRFYTVVSDLKLPTKYWKKGRDRHRLWVNRRMRRIMQTDPEFAKAIRTYDPALADFFESGNLHAAPINHRWHHALKSQTGPTQFQEFGHMHLVPANQHSPWSAWNKLLHPNGYGGYKEWGGPPNPTH